MLKHICVPCSTLNFLITLRWSYFIKKFNFESQLNHLKPFTASLARQNGQSTLQTQRIKTTFGVCRIVYKVIISILGKLFMTDCYMSCFFWLSWGRVQYNCGFMPSFENFFQASQDILKFSVISGKHSNFFGSSFCITGPHLGIVHWLSVF